MRQYKNHLLPVSVARNNKLRKEKATITGVVLLVLVAALVFVGRAVGSRHDRLLGDVKGGHPKRYCETVISWNDICQSHSPYLGLVISKRSELVLSG